MFLIVTHEEPKPTGSASGGAAGRRPRHKALSEHVLWEEMLLYSSKSETAYSLNPSARAIWELCDGQRTLVDISQELSRTFDRSPEELLPDVQTAVVQMEQLGLLEPEETPGTSPS
jgi:hypothetical protein